ncbi:nitroreductase/quinone reductase family protein [Chloroflexota bacterium]
MQTINRVSKRLFRSFFITADKITQIVYRISNGVIGLHQLGVRILLLHTIGRKSGLTRSHALLYVPVDKGWVVVASNGGGDRHPQWYLNLVANPQVMIQVGRDKHKVLSEVVNNEIRKDYWQELRNSWPLYRKYQEGTHRKFPIILFRRESI